MVILDLLFAHGGEPDPYVQKNLYPYAVGGYFVQAHPECVIAVLRHRVPSADHSQRSSWRRMLEASPARALPELRVLIEGAG